MVSSVTLGNFFNLSNGKTVLGGAGGSGLDTQALITSLTNAKRLPATRNQDTITLNDKKSTALGKFQSLLSTFKSSLDALRNPPGVGNAADNVFKFTTSTISGSGSDYVSVVTTAGASLQSYQVSEITSVASASRQRSGTFEVANADTSVVDLVSGNTFHPGLFTFAGQNIEIVADDTLNSIAAKFNSISDSTGVSASIIAIDATHYQLSFVATNTGTLANFDLTTANDPDGVLTDIDLSAAVAGTNAIFKLNDVPITRQTNIISDVISNVTFTILQTTPTVDPINVTIKPDTATVQNVINNFMINYNALKSFAAEQTQLKTDGTPGDAALLANNQTFLGIMNNINSQINAQVAGITGGGFDSLVDIGITFTNTPATETLPEVSNTLTVDDGKLTSALSANFAAVQKLFGFTLTSDNANLSIFTHNNSLSVSALTITVGPPAPTRVFTATYDTGSGPVTVNLTATPIGNNVPGYKLTGPSGSPIEGLQLLYASESAATITASLTQGVADKLFNTTEGSLTRNTGSIALELTSIKEANDRLTTEIAEINKQVDVFQDQLLAKMTALESAISRVNSLLSSLTANDNQRYASSQ